MCVHVFEFFNYGRVVWLVVVVLERMGSLLMLIPSKSTNSVVDNDFPVVPSVVSSDSNAVVELLPLSTRTNSICILSFGSFDFDGIV